MKYKISQHLLILYSLSEPSDLMWLRLNIAILMKLLPYNLCDQICGPLYAKQGRIDHQMLMQRVSRGISCVAFVVGTSCLVDLHDGAFRILFGHFQRIHAVFQPSFIRRVDEDIQHIRFILQQKIGAAAHDDAAGFPGQIQNDVFLDIKDHILDVLFIGAKGKHVGKEMVAGGFFRVTDLGDRQV